MAFEYDRINRLYENLVNAGLQESTISEVMIGAESIKKSSKPAVKTKWMQEAMVRLDACTDLETRRRIREGCACCLGGKRLELSKGIYKKGNTLAERVELANQTPFVFGHSVKQIGDRRYEVRFGPEGPAQFACPCLKGAEGSLSVTYCMCCGGHVKHHLQTALGVKLKCEVVSSILSTEGRETCVFHLEQID